MRRRLLDFPPAARLSLMLSRMFRKLAAVSIAFAIAACNSHTDKVPGDASDHQPWNGISAKETVHFVGTEPFWSGTVGPDGLTYATPDNEKGQTVPASRFAGRGGVSYSGALVQGPVTVMITPDHCTDGMSDAVYPFAVTMLINAQTRQGCGWTDRQPRQGAK